MMCVFSYFVESEQSRLCRDAEIACSNIFCNMNPNKWTDKDFHEGDGLRGKIPFLRHLRNVFIAGEIPGIRKAAGGAFSGAVRVLFRAPKWNFQIPAAQCQQLQGPGRGKMWLAQVPVMMERLILHLLITVCGVFFSFLCSVTQNPSRMVQKLISIWL